MAIHKISPGQLQLPAADPGVVRLSDRYLKPGSRILDIGCGIGRNALYLARQGHDVLGIDKDEAYIESANNLASTLGSGALRLSFEQEDIFELALEAKSFDAIFITRMLQECGSRERSTSIIERAQRLTKSRGLHFVTAYIGTPEEQEAKPNLVVFNPGEVATAYKEWDMVHHDQQVFPPKQIDGATYLRSYDELVVRRPISTPATSLPLQQLSMEYYRRADPEFAQHLEAMQAQ